jgi:branched-chain amino acid transport system permease protein
MSPAQIADPGTFWPVVWSVAVLAVATVLLIARSRWGRLLRGIQENEDRLRHSGFNTYLPKLAAFTFAGLLGGIAGVLQAMFIGFASPDLLSFNASGNAITSSLIGGFENPVGPIAGAVLFKWGQDQFGATGQLYLYTGLALMIVLVVFPRGIVGVAAIVCRRTGALRERSRHLTRR